MKWILGISAVVNGCMETALTIMFIALLLALASQFIVPVLCDLKVLTCG